MTEEVKSAIKRIDELSALARSAWFSLLGYLAFMAVTLFSMTDADFLIDGRQTKLPIIDITVPTRLFFWLAPILATILYLNLHLYLTKLWGAFADAPDDRDARLADQIQPWLINDFALDLKAGANPRDIDRVRLRKAVTIFTTWLSTPLILWWGWFVSIPARDPVTSLVILACLIISVGMGFESWFHAQARLRALPRPRHYVRAFMAVCAAGAAVTLFTTNGIHRMTTFDAGKLVEELREDPAGTLDLARFTRLNVDRDNIVGLPKDWASAESSRETFRQDWCEIKGLDLAVCGNMPAKTLGATNYIIMQRRGYCARKPDNSPAKFSDCVQVFTRADQEFDAAWAATREAELGSLPELDLSQRFLANASAISAKLVRAKLYLSELPDANLAWADLEGASLVKADLTNAEAFYADFARANLTGAVLRNANFGSSDFEGAVLNLADLDGAGLTATNLVAADLLGADLTGATLVDARMHRANLTGAILDGADLTGAYGLTGPQLLYAVGDAKTRLPLPRTISPDPSRPDQARELYVWSCWKTLPRALTAILPDEEKPRYEKRVCPKGTDPARVGRQFAPGSDAPAENQLASN